MLVYFLMKCNTIQKFSLYYLQTKPKKNQYKRFIVIFMILTRNIHYYPKVKIRFKYNK